MISKSANLVETYKNIPIRICNSWPKIIKLVKYVKTTGHCSFDFETNGVPPDQDHFYPTIVGITFQPGARYVVPLNHFESPFKGGEWLRVLGYLNDEVFSNPSIIKYAHNGKFELHILLKYGYNVLGRFFDTMLAKHLLDENTLNGLKDIIIRLFPEYSNYDQELNLIKREHGNEWQNIPLRPLSVYCSLDCDLTLRLHSLLERRLFDLPKLYSLYRNLAMMNTRVLAESECFGIPVNIPYLDRITHEQGIKIAKNLKAVMNHDAVIKFDKTRRKDHIKKLIDSTNDEISKIELEEDISSATVKRKIQHRIDKVSRYIAGDLITKKEIFKPFNLNSPKQLVEFLYTKKGLDLDIVMYTKDKKTKKETTNPSTEEKALLQLKPMDDTGFIDKLLDHRERSKLYSTYMVGIKERVNPRTKKVHGRFLLHGTVTGRLSSQEPNLQNIPRDTTSSLIKRMFIPPPGYLIVEIDYSQAELRYIAEVAGDKNMIRIFKEGKNIHLATGLKINGISMDHYDEANEVRKNPGHEKFKYWSKVHKSGKVTNFSILYQQGERMTAESLGVTIDEAIEFKNEWYAQFPGITKFLKKHIDRVFELGYAENTFGRRRRLPDIRLRSKVKTDYRAMGKYNKATRDAINAPIQGGSSDYTQAAAVEIWERRQRGEEPFIYAPYEAYTVHDSLGYFCKPEHIHKFVPAIMEVATNPIIEPYYGFKFNRVKMKVSAEVGINWGDKAEYDPNRSYKELLQ